MSAVHVCANVYSNDEMRVCLASNPSTLKFLEGGNYNRYKVIFGKEEWEGVGQRYSLKRVVCVA